MPFSPIDNTPTSAYLAGDYIEAAGSGSWDATAGDDAAATTNAPTASTGAPLFASGKVALAAATLVSTFLGADDNHLVAVAELNSITPGADANPWNQQALVTSSGGDCGLAVTRTGAGPYQFFATFWMWDDGDSQPALATVEITDKVDASGAGRIALQGKRAEDPDDGNAMKVWLKANGDAFVPGDECDDVTYVQNQTLVIGANYAGAYVLDGRVESVFAYDSAQDDTFANAVAVWAGVAGEWTITQLTTMPDAAPVWHSRDGAQMVQLASGRVLMIGGWNSTQPWLNADVPPAAQAG